MVSPQPPVNEKRAAEMLGVTPGTLSVWRSTRRYPLPYVKVGRAVRYRVADIEAFMQSRTVTDRGPDRRQEADREQG